MNVLQTGSAFWQRRSPRERLALQGLLVLLVLLGLWRWSVQPAWQAWRTATERHAKLAHTSQALAQWQAQAQALQALPPQATLQGAELAQWLQTQTPRWLGPEAQVQTQAKGFEVRWQQASAEGVAQWLSKVRTQAHLVPHQAQLEQLPASGTAAPLWRGSVWLSSP